MRIYLLLISLLFAACRSLSSVTTIKPNDTFILGNNEHGKFNVRLKNISDHNLEICKSTISGTQHSKIIVKPNEKVRLEVESNTAVKINNRRKSAAKAELLVKGDTGLSKTDLLFN